MQSKSLTIDRDKKLHNLLNFFQVCKLLHRMLQAGSFPLQSTQASPQRAAGKNSPPQVAMPAAYLLISPKIGG